MFTSFGKDTHFFQTKVYLSQKTFVFMCFILKKQGTLDKLYGRVLHLQAYYQSSVPLIPGVILYVENFFHFFTLRVLHLLRKNRKCASLSSNFLRLFNYNTLFSITLREILFHNSLFFSQILDKMNNVMEF